MGVTRVCISRILELKEMLLSFQKGLNLVNVAVVCGVLESTTSLEPSSDTTEPRYFEACDCLKLLSVKFDFLVDAAGVVCRQLCLLGTDLHTINCGGFVEMLN